MIRNILKPSRLVFLGTKEACLGLRDLFSLRLSLMNTFRYLPRGAHSSEKKLATHMYADRKLNQALWNLVRKNNYTLALKSAFLLSPVTKEAFNYQKLVVVHSWHLIYLDAVRHFVSDNLELSELTHGQWGKVTILSTFANY